MYRDHGVKRDGMGRVVLVVLVTCVTKRVCPHAIAHRTHRVTLLMGRAITCQDHGVWLDGGDKVVLVVLVTCVISNV
jgi:hypothetical protein